MNNGIQKYLGELREALAGRDVATVQDALSDAEEHLTTALAASAETEPDLSEGNRLARVIEEYGSPKEIAAAYRIIERQTRPELAVPSQFYQRSLASRFVSVVYDPRAWGALLYLVISMLTGVIYFTWVITGLYLSVGLLILIIGLPIAWLFFLSFRGIALVEGRIVEGLLGVRMPRRPIFSDQRLKWGEQLKALVRDRRTWTGIAYMLLQLPLGIIYFTVAVLGFALSLDCVSVPIAQYVFDQPFIKMGERHIFISGNLMPLVVALGPVLFLTFMHIARGLGKLHGKLAKAMLVGKDSGR